MTQECRRTSRRPAPIWPRRKKRSRVAKAGGHASQVAKAAADLQKAQASRDQLRRDNESLTKLVAEKAATPAGIGTESIAC